MHRQRPPKRTHGAPPRGDARHVAGRGAQPVAKGGDELTYGLRAGLALLAARPAEVRAVHVCEAAWEELDRTLASLRGPKPRVVETAEHALERLAGTRQHEGLVVEAKPRRFMPPAELADTLLRTRGACLALDRVRNPYNVGAILRTAAFFGVDAALLGTPAPHPALAPDAVRVAEGGVEHLALSRTTDLAETLTRLRARGVQVVGADGQATDGALGFRFVRPVVVVVGNEREGLGPRVRAQCDAIVAIRGTGAVESLNVAVAASILVSEVMRSRGSPRHATE